MVLAVGLVSPVFSIHSAVDLYLFPVYYTFMPDTRMFSLSGCGH